MSANEVVSAPGRPIAMARSWHDEEEVRAVADVLGSGRLTAGPKGAELEAAVADLLGARHAVAVASGTAALELALRAVGVGPGDEVIVPSFTYIASAAAVVACGATPVLVDVEETIPVISVAAADSAITERTAAIIAVHLYGHPADTVGLADLAASRGVTVIDDAAQALGAADRGRPIGSAGTACLSFHGSKHLSTGEGGMIVTGDGAIAERARVLRNHGTTGPYLHTVLGSNHRLPETSAAIGTVQVRRQATWLWRRRAIADRLRTELADVAIPVRPGAQPSWASFPLRIHERRDRVLAQLVADGIDARAYYPRTLHDQPALEPFARLTDVVHAPRAAAQVLCLPCHPHLGDDDVDRMVAAVRRCVDSEP